MRFSQTLAAILLCASTLILPSAAAANPHSSQKTRAKAQTPAPHTEITKEKIEAIVNAIEESVKKKHTAVLFSYLAPDFKYKLDGGGRPTRQANRAHYVELIKLAMPLILDYSYLRKSLTITIAPDGQSATAHATGFEMTTLAQGTLAAHTTSLSTFKIYKGKILISATEATIEYVA
jgi:hypothetical protein